MAPEAPKAKSFADILQQNQEFITHLQALQEDIGGQLEEKEKELALTKRQLAEKQQDLTDPRTARRSGPWIRRPCSANLEAAKKGHRDRRTSTNQPGSS